MERMYRFLHESLIHLLNRLVQECRYCVLFGDVQICILPWLCLIKLHHFFLSFYFLLAFVDVTCPQKLDHIYRFSSHLGIIHTHTHTHVQQTVSYSFNIIIFICLQLVKFLV